MVLEKIKKEYDNQIHLKNKMDEMGLTPKQKNWIYKLTSQRFEKEKMIQMLDIAKGAYKLLGGDPQATKIKIIDELVDSYNKRYFFHNFEGNIKNSEMTDLINSEIDAEGISLEERFTVLKIFADLVVNDAHDINPFKLEKRGSTLKEAGFIIKREKRKITQ